MPKQINRVELNHRTVPARVGHLWFESMGVGSSRLSISDHYYAAGAWAMPGLSRCGVLAWCQWNAWRGDRADQGVHAELLAQPQPARRVCRAFGGAKCRADGLMLRCR